MVISYHVTDSRKEQEPIYLTRPDLYIFLIADESIVIRIFLLSKILVQSHVQHKLQSMRTFPSFLFLLHKILEKCLAHWRTTTSVLIFLFFPLEHLGLLWPTDEGDTEHASWLPPRDVCWHWQTSGSWNHLLNFTNTSNAGILLSWTSCPGFRVCCPISLS